MGDPKPARLRPFPAMGADEETDDGSVVVGPGKALANCVVALELDPAIRPKAVPADPPTRIRITLADGWLTPRISIGRAPVQVELANEVRGDWNAHGYRRARGRDTVFNLSVSPGTVMDDVAQAYLDEPDAYEVTDDARGHFTAWVHVVRTEFVARTKAEADGALPPGGFRFEGVPPGAHVLRVWHEPMDRSDVIADGRASGYRIGRPVETSRAVRVAPGAEVSVDVEVPAKPEAPPGAGSAAR